MKTRTRMLPLALLTLELLSPPALRADDFGAAALSETDFFSSIPDVISATRMPQKLTDAPASISIIDREMIRASGAIYITDLFRLVPGFQTFRVSSNKFGVTYHGVSDDFPRRLEVLIDGRSVYLPLLSTVDWNSLGISLNDIERIEVVRGSNVPAYGSNAFLGAINIVTRSPYSETGAAVQVTGGSQDTRRIEGRFSTPLGSTQTRISAGHDRNDGSDLFHDGARSNYLNISSGLTPTLADTLSLQAGFSDGYADRSQLDKTTNPVVKREHSANYQYLYWDHLNAPNSEIRLSAYHNYLDLSVRRPTVAELVTYEGLPESLAAALLLSNPDFRLDSEHGTTELYDVELQHTFRMPELDSALIWGLGYRQDIGKSDILMQDLGRITEDRWRLFGNLELTPFRPVTLNLGAMVESSTTGASDPRVSPRVAANYGLDDRSSIRLAYSNAYRMPSLLEKNAQYSIYFVDGSVLDHITAPNHDLGPEQITTWELGYYRAFTSGRGFFDLRLFHEEIDNAISSYWTPAPDPLDGRLQYYENATRWQNAGAEVQLKLQFSDAFWALLNYSYTNTTDYVRDKGPDPDKGGTSEDHDPKSPLHTASLLLNLDLPQQWQLSAAQYYIDEVEWDEGNAFREGERSGLNLTDVRLGKRIRLDAGSSMEAALIMQNVLGNEYVEFYQFNGLDRRSYLQLTLNF